MNENAAVYFVDRHRKEGRAGKPAFREAAGKKRVMTYGELADASARFAGALGRAGIRREERALMLIPDQTEFLTVFWGAVKAGVVPVPLNTLLAPAVYGEILKDSRASCVFVSEGLYPALAGALEKNADVRRVAVIADTAPEDAETFSAFTDGAEAAAPVEVPADETAFWLYSSGSTGRPKGVRHVHSAMKHTSDTYGAQVLGIKETDKIYSAAKMFFAYGLGNAVSFPMAAGAETVLYDARPTPESVSGILARESPSIFCGVPTLYAAMLHHWEQTGAPPALPALRICISAGEALPAEVGRKWRKFTGTDIMDGVGSTEMLHIFLSNTPDDIAYGASGRAVPGYELRLVDENGADVKAGEIGELLVNGASASDGYWNQREKSRATFEGVWTRTGDKYELTEDGRFIYCGRTDDMFKVSGIWVSPFEVEQALAAHSAVLEAAVVAKRDDDGLEKPKAFVVLKDRAGTPPEDLKDFVKDSIGKWKYPRWIEVVDELPKTATGKIQRFKLRGGA